MPVTHDSDEWRNLTTTVTRIDRDLLELSKKQQRQHEENVVRMDRIEDTQQTLSTDVAEINRIITRVEGAFDGAKAIGKLIAWLLGFVLLMQSVYMLFGPNIRKSVGLPNSTSAPPAAVSRYQSSEPQSAHQ
jgi:hypothetical protein